MSQRSWLRAGATCILIDADLQKTVITRHDVACEAVGAGPIFVAMPGTLHKPNQISKLAAAAGRHAALRDDGCAPDDAPLRTERAGSVATCYATGDGRLRAEGCGGRRAARRAMKSGIRDPR